MVAGAPAAPTRGQRHGFALGAGGGWDWGRMALIGIQPLLWSLGEKRNILSREMTCVALFERKNMLCLLSVATLRKRKFRGSAFANSECIFTVNLLLVLVSSNLRNENTSRIAQTHFPSCEIYMLTAISFLTMGR